MAFTRKIEKVQPGLRNDGGWGSDQPVTFNGLVTFTGGTSGVSGGGSPITSTSNQAFAVGPGGNTNPVFNVDGSTASQATGLNINGRAAGSGTLVSVISSGTNEALSISSKGSGAINLTGGTGASVNALVPVGVNSTSANSLTVGPNGATNPGFQVDSSTSSAVTGIQIKGAAAGSGVGVGVISSGTNENLILNSKGSGTCAVQTFITQSAGGAVGAGIQFTSALTGLYAGTGAPTLSAAKGSIYTNTTATTITTRLYVNTDGATTWTNLTTTA